MAMIVQVTVTDEATGEVTKTFSQAFSESDPWDTARAIRTLLRSVFVAVFGRDDEWN